MFKVWKYYSLREKKKYTFSLKHCRTKQSYA
jgi:hypothetical protein